jgi:hypothetical protein
MTRLASVKYIGRRAGDQPSPVLHAAAGLIAAIWAKCSSTMAAAAWVIHCCDWGRRVFCSILGELLFQ